MEIEHPQAPPRLERELSVRADVRIDLLASVAAALVTGLATYLVLQAARAVRDGDKIELEFEVEAEARRADRPLTEPVP